MENWQKEMEQKIDEISENMKMLIDALIGNALTKNIGFIDKLQYIEKEVEKLKSESATNKLMRSVGIGVGTVIGFIIEMIVQWFSNKK